jgi:hypothetical protein
MDCHANKMHVLASKFGEKSLCQSKNQKKLVKNNEAWRN